MKRPKKGLIVPILGLIFRLVKLNITLLGNVLFTKTQQKVLALLFGKPDETFYLNEIVRLAGIGKGTIKRELEKMLSAELLTVTHIGNQNHYQANKRCPIYSDLLNIVRKTFGVAGVLHDALQPLEKDIDLAFVYGSVSKGMDTASSDIDLMVVTNSLAYADVIAELIKAEALLGRSINPTLYDKKQLKSKLESENAFITRVMEQPKIWIKGTDDAIREFR